MKKKQVKLLDSLPDSPEKGALIRVFRLEEPDATDENARFIEYVGTEYCAPIAKEVEDIATNGYYEDNYEDTGDVNNLFDYLSNCGEYRYLIVAITDDTIYVHLIEEIDPYMSLGLYFNVLAKANEKLCKGFRFDSGKRNGVVEIGKLDGINDVVYENKKPHTIFDDVIKPNPNIVVKIPNVKMLKAPAFIPLKKG